MIYQRNTSGNEVRLEVLACADKSLVGLNIDNCRIVRIPADEFRMLVYEVIGPREINTVFYSTFGHDKYNGTEDFIVLETVKNDSIVRRNDYITDALKLYKGPDIYICYWIAYRYNRDVQKFQGANNVRMCRYEHAYNEIAGRYTLSEQEKAEFPVWLAEHYELVQPKPSTKFGEIIKLYLDSYLIGKANPAFVMLFVVLEMLYGGNDRAEISHNIRKGVSELLGKTSADRRNIRNDIYRLYDERSQYVHDGIHVKWKSLFALREYVRRVIVTVYENNRLAGDEFWNMPL